MKVVALVALSLAITTSVVSTFSFGNSEPEWDDLRVTWGPNVLTKYKPQPRTQQDAVNHGFRLVGSTTCDGTGVYNGFAYVKDNDYSVTLLYDKNGYIAGIQHGITKEQAEKAGYPSKKLQPPFVYTDGRLVLTAYFTDPSKICTEGRTQAQFNTEGTGTNLWIQTGNTPSQVTLIPRQQSALSTTKWVDGKCFITMGEHYWYNIKPDMDCDTFFPVFLLYNGGKLNAFGWAFLADLESPNYEHPSISVLGAFIQQVPTCISKITHPISTMHIYLTSTPLLDAC
ncbi:hypothetical protein ElyMa_005868900 [Elysia marginata]|uniref:Uncharacterized protein n=1 Tax=Elysia marginata TaxID=1093978 RepID=A0AAV4G2T6_9GAST|nr:hypothetical protein ElyMa_005868900 [Elysia marginata]